MDAHTEVSCNSLTCIGMDTVGEPGENGAAEEGRQFDDVEENGVHPLSDRPQWLEKQ